MIVGADAGFYDTYPKSVDPNTKSPYVMWAGTPYQTRRHRSISRKVVNLPMPIGKRYRRLLASWGRWSRTVVCDASRKRDRCSRMSSGSSCSLGLGLTFTSDAAVATRAEICGSGGPIWDLFSEAKASNQADLRLQFCNVGVAWRALRGGPA